MATITNYASLVQAVTDWTHRSDLATGNYIDYFVQNALEQIQNDIFFLNFGNGIALMENAYPATAISGGTAPVPVDWLAPKVMSVLDNGGNVFPLEFKSVAWLYNTYPMRQPTGIPAYIARDLTVSGGGAFVQSLSQQIAGNGGVAYTLTIPAGSAVLSVVVDGSTLYPTTDYSVVSTTLTFVNPVLVGQNILVTYLAPLVGIAASVTSAFVFGPYPDSAYTIQGTYYQAIPALNGGAPTNWVVLSAPQMLHAYCMMEAAKFIGNDAMYSKWESIAQPRLKALVDRDKAERWAAATMQVETA